MGHCICCQLSGWGCHKSPFVQQWSIPAEKLRADIVIPRPTLCMGMSLIILSEYHSAKGNWPISYSTLVLKARWTMIANYSFRTRELHGDKYLSPSPTVPHLSPHRPHPCAAFYSGHRTPFTMLTPNLTVHSQDHLLSVVKVASVELLLPELLFPGANSPWNKSSIQSICGWYMSIGPQGERANFEYLHKMLIRSRSPQNAAELFQSRGTASTDCTRSAVNRSQCKPASCAAYTVRQWDQNSKHLTAAFCQCTSMQLVITYQLIWSVFNWGPIHVLEPLFCNSSLNWTTFGQKIGPGFMNRFWMLIHKIQVMWHLQLQLFGCLREFLYLWIERYLMCSWIFWFLIYVLVGHSMLSNTGSTESAVKS